MNHNWYIGQDIVCIKTHSMGIVKEGEVYTIKGLRQSCCHVQIDVGKSAIKDHIVCRCGNTTPAHGISWLGEFRFAPLDTLTDISEIEEILNQPIYQ